MVIIGEVFVVFILPQKLVINNEQLTISNEGMEVMKKMKKIIKMFKFDKMQKVNMFCL